MPAAPAPNSWYGPLTIFSLVVSWSPWLCKMDSRTQAKNLYSELRCPDKEEDGTEGKLQQTRMYIQQHLHHCEPNSRFQFREFATIISDSAAMPYFHPTKASAAFQNLEFCLILILNCPWKTEYKTVKKYSGFFQSKLEAHLQNSACIFKLVGYSEEHNGILTLVRRINKDVILAVAFECLVAAEECIIINAAHASIGDSRISYAHVVRVRSTHAGDGDRLAALVRKDLPYNSNHLLKERRPDLEIVHTDTPATGVNSKLPDEFVKEALHDSVHIPYADDDLTDRQDLREATFDEHCMASLRLLQEDVVRPKVEAPARPSAGSDEWSFVREGLQDKFGQEYFTGARGDVLLGDEMVDKEDVIGRDVVRPLVQPPAPRPHGVPGVPSYRDSGYQESYNIYYPPTADTGYESAKPATTSSASYYKAMPPSDVTHVVPPSGVYTMPRPGEYPMPHASEAHRGNTGTYLHPVHGGSDAVQGSPRHVTPASDTRAHAYTELLSGGTVHPELPSDMMQAGRTYPQLMTREARHNSQSQSGRHTFPTPPYTSDYDATNKRPLTKSHSLKSPTETTSRHSPRPLPNPPVMKEFVTEQTYNTAPPYVTSRSAPVASRETRTVLEPRFQQQQQQQHQRQSGSERIPGWQCNFCTFLNNYGATVCESCGKSRGTRNIVPEVTIRKCQMCTFENPPDVKICGVCSSDNLSAVQSSV